MNLQTMIIRFTFGMSDRKRDKGLKIPPGTQAQNPNAAGRPFGSDVLDGGKYLSI